MYPSYAIILNLHWLTAVTTSRGSNIFAKSSCDETLKVCFQRPDISGLLDAATQRISCAFRQGCALSHSICDQASLGRKWSQIRAMTTVMSSLLFYPKKRSWSDASHDSEACITFKDFKNWFLFFFKKKCIRKRRETSVAHGLEWKGEKGTELPAEAMSEMQRLLHATSVSFVRCGMRAREGTIAQVRLLACAIAYCPRMQYRCQICPWEK